MARTPPWRYLLPMWVAAALVACGCGVSGARAAATHGAAAAAPSLAASRGGLARETAAGQRAPSLAGERATTFSGNEALTHVQQLAGSIGPRPAGAPAADVAADYIAATLVADGYAVERQPFDFPEFDERQSTLSARAEQGTDGAAATMPAHALLYSAAGEVSGPLVFAGFGLAGELAPGSLNGAIALLERGANVTFRDKVAAAARAGAAGAIIYNNAPNEFVGSLQVPSAIPVLGIAGEAGRRLREQLAQGPLVVQMAVDAGVEERRTQNVVATRPAASSMDAIRTLVIGAHYDSVPISPGANDNASGIAVLLEMARVLADDVPDVSLRFVAFGGEELGLLGSAHYVGSLSDADRASIAGMLNLDMVGVGDTFLAGGDEGLLRVVDQAGAAAGLHLGRLPGDYAQRSDHASFLAAGIPGVFLYVSDDPNYHTPGDVPANVSAERLQQAGSLGVDVVHRLAQR